MPGAMFDLNDNFSFKRRGVGNRPRKNLFLVVCAGDTEEVYFNSYRKPDLSADIKIRRCKATDPVNIVKFAIARMNDLGLSVGSGDFAYCVFDIDENTPQNLEKAAKLAVRKGIVLCPSNPCFELWYLLHFNYSDANLTSQEAEERINEYIQNYEKTRDYSNVLYTKRDTAISNAKKLQAIRGEGNPSTSAYKVVEKLLNVHLGSAILRRKEARS